MHRISAIRLCALAAVALFFAPSASPQAPTCFPADKAVSVNPDTHLVLTFPTPPTLGRSGQVRIYDAAGHTLVDTLDLSIPAGPDPTRRITAAPPTPPPAADAAAPTSPTTTTPAVRTTPADLHNYQLTTIGGLPDFHFYPVILHGNTATIYPHNNALHYHHKYIVQIDPAVFSNAFPGFTTDAAFFNHCELQSIGPFMWIRNTDANHGNVFLNSTFIARERPAPPPQAQASTPPPTTATPARAPMAAVLARLPNNHGLNYPYAEAVLINCHLKGIPPAGWGPIEDDTTHLHLWEFNSTDLDGHPIDTTERHPVSKQLTQPQDSQTIANYSNPAFVLGGWAPVVDQ